MKFKKGDIVPNWIIGRTDQYYDKITFGVDVEVIEDTVYPSKVLKGKKHIILVDNVVGPISINKKISTLPKLFDNPNFINTVIKYGPLNLGD